MPEKRQFFLIDDKVLYLLPNLNKRILLRGVFNEDYNAMSNYFLAIEVFSNFGVILESNNNFQGSY